VAIFELYPFIYNISGGAVPAGVSQYYDANGFLHFITGIGNTFIPFGQTMVLSGQQFLEWTVTLRQAATNIPQPIW